MSKYALRLPNSLFEHAKHLAAKENTSLNQLFITAIAEKLAVLDTEDFLLMRGKSASKKAYLEALNRVKNSKPIPGDEIE